MDFCDELGTCAWNLRLLRKYHYVFVWSEVLSKWKPGSSAWGLHQLNASGLLHGFIICLFLWILNIVLALKWKKTYWENQHTNGWPFHGFASCLFLWTLHIVLTFEWKRTYCENQHTNRWPFQGFDIVCGSRSGSCPWVGAKTGRLCCEEFGGDRHVRLQSNGGEVRHLLHLHQFQRAVIVAIVVTVIIWIDLWCPSSLRICMHNRYFGCYHRCFLHQCVRM